SEGRRGDARGRYDDVAYDEVRLARDLTTRGQHESHEVRGVDDLLRIRAGAIHRVVPDAVAVRPDRNDRRPRLETTPGLDGAGARDGVDPVPTTLPGVARTRDVRAASNQQGVPGYSATARVQRGRQPHRPHGIGDVL